MIVSESISEITGHAGWTVFPLVGVTPAMTMAGKIPDGLMPCPSVGHVLLGERHQGSGLRVWIKASAFYLFRKFLDKAISATLAHPTPME